MQVINTMKISSASNGIKSLSFNEGDVSSALVKEKLPNQEAVLNIRGNDVKMKLQGDYSANDRVTIEVKDPKSSPPAGRVLERNPLPAATQYTNSAEKSVKIVHDGHSSPQIKQAVELLTSKGTKLNNESLQQLKSYMGEVNRTSSQKLETIHMMAVKRLEITPANLRAVDQSLHGEGVSRSLDQLLKAADPNFSWSEIRKTLENSRSSSVDREQPSRNLNQLYQKAQAMLKAGSTTLTEIEQIAQTGKRIDNAIGQRLDQALKLLKNTGLSKETELLLRMKQSVEQMAGTGELLNQLDRLLSKGTLSGEAEGLLRDVGKLLSIKGDLASKVEGLLLQTTGDSVGDSDSFPLQRLVQSQLKMVQREPQFTKIMESLKMELSTSGVDEIQSNSLQNAIGKADALFQGGKELAARQELLNTLSELEKSTNPIPLPNKEAQVQAETYSLNDEMLSMIPMQSKDVIVSTITTKLSQMAIDFKALKRDIGRNLDSISQIIQQSKSRAAVTARPMLETTIKQLDQAIMKSDIMLYADMKTEKSLMNASSQLAEAKKLLSRGDHSSAHKIVQEVKGNMEKLIFKPSDVRVKHFVSQEVLRYDSAPLTSKIGQSVSQSIQSFSHEPSSRHAYEFVRSMGHTFESEQAQSLVSSGRAKEDLHLSLKNILMKFNQSDMEMQGTTKADTLLQNLTGQQLMSKNDASGLQNMMFTLPLLLQDKVEDVKVYVNSKNEQQKVDWENCSLFFLIETRKLGEVGIALNAADRVLSVQIKNDQEGFKEKMEPVTNIAKSRLEEIGYTIGSLKFTPLNKSTEPNEIDTASTDNKGSHLAKVTEKGYDFTV